METKELDNLNRDELFEKIKRKCISRARVDFFGGIIILIILIALFIYLISRGTILFDDANFFSSIFAITLVCMAGWLVLYSYWYKKKIEKIDKPSELLHYFGKKSRIFTIFCLVLCFAVFGVKFVNYFRTTTIGFEHVLLAIAFVVLVYLIYVTNKPGSVRARDMEIIKQLQDLIDKE